MNVLLVSQAKYGVKNVIHGVAPHLACREDIEIEYLTLPIHAPPSGCSRSTLLDERLVNSLDGFGIPYLAYAVLNFWRRAYNYIDRRSDEFDVIWLHNPRLLSFASEDISEQLLVTYHSHLQHEKADYYDFPQKLYYRLFGRIERRGIRKHADARYTAVNPEVINELQELEPGEDSTTYIANGVDVEKFRDHDGAELRDKWDLPSGTILLSVGRLEPVKRPLALLKAYRHLSSRYSESISLVFVGDGSLRGRMKEYVSKHDLDTVELLGFVDPEEIHELYATADCFVLSTQYDPGGPLVLYEALASRLPSIVPDLPNMEFVERESCGTTVDFESPSVAAKQIDSYLAAKDESHEENARQYAEEHLSWAQRADEYYDELRLVAG